MHQRARRSAQPLGVILNALSQVSSERVRTWYLVHVLAGLTLLVVLSLVSVQVYPSVTQRFQQLPAPVLSLLAVCVFSLLWFWVRMLSDYFGERPRTHATAWGWFLFLGAYFGALAYFWVVWRPRHRLNDT